VSDSVFLKIVQCNSSQESYDGGVRIARLSRNKNKVFSPRTHPLSRLLSLDPLFRPFPSDCFSFSLLVLAGVDPPTLHTLSRNRRATFIYLTPSLQSLSCHPAVDRKGMAGPGPRLRAAAVAPDPYVPDDALIDMFDLLLANSLYRFKCVFKA
jgi:hypothetical protein